MIGLLRLILRLLADGLHARAARLRPGPSGRRVP